MEDKRWFGRASIITAWMGRRACSYSAGYGRLRLLLLLTCNISDVVHAGYPLIQQEGLGRGLPPSFMCLSDGASMSTPTFPMT